MIGYLYTLPSNQNMCLKLLPNIVLLRTYFGLSSSENSLQSLAYMSCLRSVVKRVCSVFRKMSSLLLILGSSGFTGSRVQCGSARLTFLHMGG